MTDKDLSRRTLLGRLTMGVGGLMGLVTAIPLVRYFLHPVGKKVVSLPDAPIDVGAASDFLVGAKPVRLPIIASGVRDGWNSKDQVAVGACWLQKTGDGEFRAFSSVCPHLGCSVSFSPDNGDFRCPCHNSSFAEDGSKKDNGPAKRGLDPLDVHVEGGRVLVRYQRFRNDISEREPV